MLLKKYFSRNMSCKQQWETGELSHVLPLVSLIVWVTLCPLFAFWLAVFDFVGKILDELSLCLNDEPSRGYALHYKIM
jgi:hypothetical protein